MTDLGKFLVSGVANERRRCTHHPISMAASLRLDEINVLPCELRDFCLGGMFLTIGDAESKQALLKTYLQQQVEIQVHVAAQNRGHVLLARVMHIAATGIGVTFEEISIPALKALFWQSTVGSRHSYLPLQSEQSSSTDLKQLKETFSRIVDQFSHQLLDAFFPAVEQALFEMSGDLINTPERISVLGSVTEFRLNRRVIEVGFCHALQGQLDQFLDDDLLNTSQTGEDASLALGKGQKLDDWIQLSEIIVENEDQYADQLVELAQKMTNLVRFTIDNQHNPIAPGSICETFREALDEIDITPSAKSTVLTTFGSILKQQLHATYQDLIILLAPLPAIKFYNDSNRQTFYGKSIGITVEHPTELISILKSGLPFKSFEVLRDNLAITEKSLVKILQLTASELHERKVRGYFHRDESERLYRVARLYDRAYELFADQEMLRSWIKMPKLALAGMSPIYYADLEPGAIEVDDLIGRLQYGVYS